MRAYRLESQRHVTSVSRALINPPSTLSILPESRVAFPTARPGRMSVYRRFEFATCLITPRRKYGGFYSGKINWTAQCISQASFLVSSIAYKSRRVRVPNFTRYCRPAVVGADSPSTAFGLDLPDKSMLLVSDVRRPRIFPLSRRPARVFAAKERNRRSLFRENRGRYRAWKTIDGRDTPSRKLICRMK